MNEREAAVLPRGRATLEQAIDAVRNCPRLTTADTAVQNDVANRIQGYVHGASNLEGYVHGANNLEGYVHGANNLEEPVYGASNLEGHVHVANVMQARICTWNSSL